MAFGARLGWTGLGWAGLDMSRRGYALVGMEYQPSLFSVFNVQCNGNDTPITLHFVDSLV